MDQDKQAVEVARLNLLLRGLHSREKLPMLENIRHADSLRPDTWVAVGRTGSPTGRDTIPTYDVIIGNPPYVRRELRQY